MKNAPVALLFVAFFLSPMTGYSKGPCQDKRKTIRLSHKALKQCNKAWQDSARGDAADPSSDCAAEQAAYVASVKDLKACHRQAKAQRK